MDENPQKMRGILLNDQGFMALKEGRIDEAVDLFQRSLKIARRIGDWEGVAITLENLYLAHRATQHYPEALATLEEVFNANLLAGSYAKIKQYWLEVAEAINTLAMFDQYCVVRDGHETEDIQRFLQATGFSRADLTQGKVKVLIAETAQDVLEVMGNLPSTEQMAFFDRITETIASHLRSRNVKDLDDLIGQ
jgi:tetratricopeptide (TPR) repeat protein